MRPLKFDLIGATKCGQIYYIASYRFKLLQKLSENGNLKVCACTKEPLLLHFNQLRRGTVISITCLPTKAYYLLQRLQGC